MEKSDYNFVSRLLHHIAMQPAVAEMSFDIDNLVSTQPKKQFTNNAVFVSGLARSGTTILLRYLCQTGCFRTLTYQDMPFVLMPNLWNKISSKKTSTQPKERAHRDGILVSFDSPEAFEEVFWRVYSGKDYICSDRLRQYEIDGAVLKKFKQYIQNVISGGAEGKTRYLSKNNNNVLRLKSLQKALPNATVIIPFRQPLQHAFSLLSQHLHFSKLQTNDKFSLKYMNWLGHFEFGLNQKPFYLDDEKAFADILGYDENDINFWLATWKNYYQYINDSSSENTLLFNYEELCRSPEALMSLLFKKLNIISLPVKLEPFSPSEKAVTGYNESLLMECESIYGELVGKSHSALA